MIWSIASTLFSPLYAGVEPYYPPELAVQGFEEGYVKLSALVFARNNVEVPKFCVGEKKEVVEPRILESEFTPGWLSYRYLINAPLGKELNFNYGGKEFTIPSFSKNKEIPILYTSCADDQPGVSENWKNFLAYANSKNVCVQLKGGDNIPYPDNGLDEIFPNGWEDREITEEEKRKVIDLYLKLYIKKLEALPKDGRIIPTITQDDDHDCYDGRGSLGESEKWSIPTFVRKVADSLFLLLQQHMVEAEKKNFGFFGGQDNYSKI